MPSSLKDENYQKKVIDNIRAEYKIGDPEAVFLQTALNRALELLSKDLYSKKSHFVLELVQNADDNEYHPDIEPQLKFSVTESRLVLTNNEVGFAEKNVWAICQTGDSSKKEKKGYIGEKGIGFKSVFTISDTPEIHSNGYHFKFDRTESGNLLGYVVPIWCDAENELNESLTTIILPAANNYKFEKNTLTDLNAHLLLFLNKLRHLSVEHNETAQSFSREDINGQTILTTKLLNSTALENDVERFIRIDHAFTIESDCLDEEKRPKINESNIVLAFPINEKGAVAPVKSSYVFAFLPVSQVGFKFAIQADFILSTNREGILTDRPWNTNLRDEIAEAFMKATEIFKKSEQLSLNYLKYLPSADDIVDPFYKRTRNLIINKLTDSECILSASNKWDSPKNLRKANKEFREIFPSPNALELFGFDYVNSKVRGVDNILEELGIESAGVEEAISIFSDHSEWLTNQSLAWQSKFYAYIADNLVDALVAGLLDLPCLPVSDGTFVVPNNEYVFFPLSKLKKYGFEHELIIINNELYEAALVLSKDNVISLFVSMDVRSDNPYELITANIFPRHKTDTWKTSDHKALIGHLRYVKDKMNDYIAHAESIGVSEVNAIKELKDNLWIGTKLNDNAWTFSRIQKLYISKEYLHSFCIESLLGHDLGQDKLVSPEYLDKKPKNPVTEAESWRDFFIRLDIRVAPAVELSGADWKCSSELQLLLESDQSSIRKATLECMNLNWDKYSECMTYRVMSGRYSYNDVDTIFAKFIRTIIAPTRNRKKSTFSLSESYYETDELKLIFGDGLPFVDAVLYEPMLKACHVTYKVEAKSLVKRLNEYKYGANYTVKQIQAIYRALDDRFWETDGAYITKYFVDNGLIHIKGVHKGWFKPNEVCWNPSNNNFLDDLYPPIHSSYRDFNRLFVDRLRVPKVLPIEKMVEALTSLDKVDSKDERCEIALTIYKRANAEISPKFGKEVDLPAWIHTFQNEAVFIDQRGEMVSRDNYLYANDSPEYAMLFVDDEDISIFEIPINEVPRLSRLLQASEVPLISESITTNVIDSEPGSINQDLSETLQRSLIYFARVVYSKRHTDFENVIEKGLFVALRKFEVVEVSQVNLSVSLHNNCHETTTDLAVTNNRLLYRKGTKSLKDRVARQVCEYLEISNEIEDAFARILTEADDISIEEYLSVKNIGELPQDLFYELFNDRTSLLDGENIDETIEDKFDEASQDAPVEEEADLGNESNKNEVIPKKENPSGISTQSPDSNPETPKNSNPTKQVASTADDNIKPTGTNAAVSRSTNEKPEQSESDIDRSAAGDGVGIQSPEPDHQPGSDSQSMRQERSEKGRKPKERTGHSQRKQTPTKSGRLLSYVEGPDESDKQIQEEDPAKLAARKATELAAVKFFMDTQAEKWQLLKEMEDKNNPGFDIYAINHDGEEEYIEVKGQSRAWTAEGVALTPRELITAYEKGERYLLCVVEFAQDEMRRELHLVQNPYGLTHRFMFDLGWKTAAETHSSVPRKPMKDMYIDMQGFGRGCIVSVRPSGKFFNLHVQLEDGRQVNKAFNPAKMKLSVGPTWQE